LVSGVHAMEQIFSIKWEFPPKDIRKKRSRLKKIWRGKGICKKGATRIREPATLRTENLKVEVSRNQIKHTKPRTPENQCSAKAGRANHENALKR